jgi:hypothetical protein
MKRKFSLGVVTLAAVCGFASAQGLYYTGSEAQESMPLRWAVGANLTWDDNVTPGGIEQDSLSISPYVGASMVNITPQTTLDVYARLGLIYYFDSPDGQGADDVNAQARLGVNVAHSFSERLRLSSRNFISYELEPDYSLGVSSARQAGEYLYWQTDNALGFRWTERFGTYTGFQLTGLDYDDVDSADRFIWSIYTQGRLLLSEQTVLTADYRYSQSDGSDLASDSTNHYLLGGVEHRVSATTIVIARGGVQWRDVDNGRDSTNPFLELAVNSQLSEQFRLRSFVRYSVEDFDTVQQLAGLGLYDFDERQTLRIGVSAEHAVTQKLSLFGGVDYIPASFDGGRRVLGAGPARVNGLDEDLVNLYIGLSMEFANNLHGTVSYNFTDSSSDFVSRSYDRNRISVGVRAEF